MYFYQKNYNSTLRLMFIALVALITLSSLTIIQAQVVYNIKNLSDNEYDDGSPHIHDGQVVWAAFDGNDGEIFLYDGVATIQITDNERDDRNPDIHGGLIAWDAFDGHDTEIFMYDGTSIIQITDRDGGLNDDYLPSIHDGKIAWVGNFLSSDWWDTIYLYDGSTIEWIDYGGHNSVYYAPILHDGMIVWDYQSTGYSVRFYNGTDTKNLVGVEYPEGNGYSPVIDDGIVAWLGRGDEYDHPSELWMYNGTTITRITNDEFADDNPCIHDGMIAWQANDSNDFEIWMYDGATKRQITDNDYNDVYPRIHNGMIVWQGSDGHDSEIYLYDGNDVIQITDNEYNDWTPKIHNGLITWRGWDGNDWEIMLARARDEPSIEWEKTFGGPGGDEGNSVQQTSDDGYVVAGEYGALIDPEEGYTGVSYLLKTDDGGILDWDETWGAIVPGVSERASSVRQTRDGGYIVCGTEGSRYESYQYLSKRYSDGSYNWSRGYSTYFDYGHAVIQTIDDGYALAGNWGGAAEDGASLIKTDVDGNFEWREHYYGESKAEAYSVQQTLDGGYILAGNTRADGAGDFDAYLCKTDSYGLMEWNKTYGGMDDDVAYSVQQTSDGGYILAGYTESYGAGGTDAYLIKTDENGVMEWQKTYGGADPDGARSVQQTCDGGYILAGYTESYGAGGRDAYLIKTDENGVMEWQKTIGGADSDEARSVQQTRDGGYILTGYTESYGASRDVYLVKIAGGEPVDLDASSGPVGKMVSMSGNGFTSGATVNSIYIGGISCGIFDPPIIVSPDGSFSGEFVIPSVPSTGLYSVYLGSDVGDYGVAQFTVTGLPYITLNPNYSPPGTLVDIYGYKFSQIVGEDVNIYFNGLPIETVETASDGTFHDTFIVPAMDFNVYVVEARQDHYNIKGESDFKVGLIVVILSETQGYPGDTIRILGTGFTPDAEWNASLNGTPIIGPAEPVDEHGNIDRDFTVPDVPPGEYTIGTLDIDTGIEIDVPFTARTRGIPGFNNEAVLVGIFLSILLIWYSRR